jgi:hypothetical protein
MRDFDMEDGRKGWEDTECPGFVERSTRFREVFPRQLSDEALHFELEQGGSDAPGRQLSGGGKGIDGGVAKGQLAEETHLERA